MNRTTNNRGQMTDMLVCLPSSVVRLLIFIYRHTLSYFLGRQCRFQPTCSAYADEALKRYGLVKGGMLALKRLSRCHPWGDEGYDPVPGTRHEA